MKTNRLITATVFLIYGAAALVPSTYPRLFPHQHIPAWLRYTTVGVLVTPLVALAGLITLGVVRRVTDRSRARRVVREVPASNGIDVLRASGIRVIDANEDDPYAFARKYSIVRRIHGDDNASRLTREEIEAEYDRYDRAETAASEDRCQMCDPDRVPASHLVEAWDERPGRNRDIGEWVLCTAHAQEKVASVRSTGAVAVSEPLVGGDVR